MRTATGSSRLFDELIYHRTTLRPLKPSLACQKRSIPVRHFSATPHRRKIGNGGRESFTSRLRTALSNTKIQWRPIPVGVGIGFLGLVQFYRVQRREQQQRQEEDALEDSASDGGGGNGQEGRPRKRKKIRPSGPW